MDQPVLKQRLGKQAYVQTWVTWLTAVTTYHGMFPSVLEHALFQVLWQVVWNDEDTFHNALGPSMCSCRSGQPRALIERTSPTCIAMTMTVVLRLLHCVDLVRHSLYIFRLIWWDLFDTLVLPMYIFPVGHCGLVFIFV